MSSPPSNPSRKDTPSLNRWGVNTVVRDFSLILIQAVLLFWSAGRSDWLNARIYIMWLLIYTVVFSIAMIRGNPELLNRRGQAMKALRAIETKNFDRTFFKFYTPLLLLTPIILGLDAGRFRWSSMPVALFLTGIFLMIIGHIVFGWAMYSNHYFEGTVQIQKDRGHQVCTAGPYRYVRHPGYLGQILVFIGTPLVLESWWGFIPAGVIVVLFGLRTAWEDRTLREELQGYREYTNHVRYRLFPLVW